MASESLEEINLVNKEMTEETASDLLQVSSPKRHARTPSPEFDPKAGENRLRPAAGM